MGGNLCLVEQYAARRVQAASDQRGGHFQRSCTQFGRVVRLGDGVKVSQEEQAPAVRVYLVLHLYPVADCAEVIAKVQISGGLNSRYDDHGALGSLFFMKMAILSRLIAPMAKATPKYTATAQMTSVASASKRANRPAA